MKRGLKFGIFVLLVVLSVYFILAASWNLAPSTTSAGSTISLIAFNVSNSTLNMNNFTNVTIALIGNASIGNITSVNISNGTFTFGNNSFTASPIIIHLNLQNVNTSTGGTNWTVNFTLSSSATYGFTVGANVTTIGNRSIDNLSYSVLPYASGTTTITESTAPTATATCPTDIYEGEAFPCTCSGTDSGTTDSGIATTSGSSNSPDGTGIPITLGTFTYTCTVTDNAGNSDGDTATYTILNIGGGAGTTPSTPKSTHSWTKITPGAATIMKDFNSEIGVKQIEITVNNEAQNVKITVTKYDGKPAAVSVSKTGKIYQYMQIAAQNLAGKLDKANVQFRVEKTWASTNGVAKEKVAVYKFDETSSKWDEQTTTYSSEDSAYYYYDVSLDSFSYFAISERSLAAGEGTTATGEEPVEEGRNLTWLWVLIALVIIVVIWMAVRKKQ